MDIGQGLGHHCHVVVPGCEISALTRAGGRIRVLAGPLVAELTEPQAAALSLVPGDFVTAAFEPSATRLITRR